MRFAIMIELLKGPLMSDENDALSRVRKNSMIDGRGTVEAALLQDDDSAAKNMWENIQALRREVVQKKTDALKAIDAEYNEKIKEAEAQYALIVSISR